jgi:hypothetical protein
VRPNDVELSPTPAWVTRPAADRDRRPLQRRTSERRKAMPFIRVNWPQGSADR